MEYLNETSIIDEIKNEYRKIDKRWMKLHYYTFVVIVFSGFIIETIIAILWYQSGSVEMSSETYLMKYVAAPIIANLLFILAGTFVIRSSRIKMIVKAYVISLLYVGASFIFYSVHSIFYSLYIIFTVPILLTIIYSDYILTSITALSGIFVKVISELFIVWDPDKINPLTSNLETVNLFISTFILLVFYMACMVVIRFERKKNAASIQKEIEHYQTRQKLKIDELTEIYNRTALRKEFQKMEKDGSGCPYFFAMIDIDNFKMLNDTFGHSQGDRCLIEFAHILTKNCSGSSMPFRFGGDEFCILFKGEELDCVLKICKEIQRCLLESPTSVNSMSMTASIGIAKYEKNMTLTKLIKNTDSMMYLAKSLDDKICVWSDNEN